MPYIICKFGTCYCVIWQRHVFRRTIAGEENKLEHIGKRATYECEKSSGDVPTNTQLSVLLRQVQQLDWLPRIIHPIRCDGSYVSIFVLRIGDGNHTMYVICFWRIDAMNHRTEDNNNYIASILCMIRL